MTTPSTRQMGMIVSLRKSNSLRKGKTMSSMRWCPVLPLETHKASFSASLSEMRGNPLLVVNKHCNRITVTEWGAGSS